MFGLIVVLRGVISLRAHGLVRAVCWFMVVINS